MQLFPVDLRSEEVKIVDIVEVSSREFIPQGKGYWEEAAWNKNTKYGMEYEEIEKKLTLITWHGRPQL